MKTKSDRVAISALVGIIVAVVVVVAAVGGTVAYLALRSHSTSTASSTTSSSSSSSSSSTASLITSTTSSSSTSSSSSSSSSTTTSSSSSVNFGGLGISDATMSANLNSSSAYQTPINRSSAFLPTMSRVYTWLNFTNIQSNFNLTFNWYLPNNTLYTSSSLSLVPGYAWETANDYIPVSGFPAENITGAWNVQTFINGTDIYEQPFYIGSYVAPLTFGDSALSPEQNATNGFPINSTVFYSTSSTEVFSWVYFSNVPSGSYNITWDYITPQGTNFGNVNQTITGPYPSGYGVSSFLDISGKYAASDPGGWYVYIYLNDNFTTPALTQSLVISTS